MPAFQPSKVLQAISTTAIPIAAPTLGPDKIVNSEAASQWRNPGDILSLLLLVGGDVLQRATAQLAGDARLPTPVVFSFGWLAYTFMALLSVLGDKRLMPATPDLQSIVINADYGHARTNQSWILGRILRDFENYWMPPDVRKALDEMLKKAKSPKAGLCISVFEADPAKEAGLAHRDLLWKAGYGIAISQLIIAAIPWVRWGRWEIFVITAGGTLLAFISASLPQWKEERWACRRKSNKTICLTQGNGAQHVLVIMGAGRGLDLEDLAGAGGLGTMSATTGPAIVTVTVLWVALLITVSGIKENTWFLLAVGALGMVYIVVAAGAPRRPEALGLPLMFKRVIAKDRTQAALRESEQHYSGVGVSLLQIFFPGGLLDADRPWWAEAEKKHKAKMAMKEKETT